MADLSDLFKRPHKTTGNKFGKILQPEAVDLRLTQLNVHRRQQRDSLLDQRRQMPKSPFVDDNNYTLEMKKNTPHEERVDKLKLWQHRRNEERAEQRRNQKPVFKVCRAPNFIPIPESKMVKKVSKMATFAPANHKFNPPKNIKLQPSTSSSTRLKFEPRKSQERVSQDSDSDQEMVTAESSCSTTPFIVLSRGKDNQRKEYLDRRKPTTGVDTPSTKSLEKLEHAMSSTTPKAAARYFTKVLDNTIADIQKLCDQWSLHREETTVDEACNMIHVAIGQSQLLINNKFKQFRNLINQCELQTEKITCEDLHGFWDMLFIQVDNLQKRFDNLVTLRNNDWIEVLPKPQVTKRPKRKPAKAKAGSSSVQRAILKAKQTMNVQKTSTTAPRRSSGLIIMVATQNLKTITPQKAKVQTPCRSILKNKSSLSKSVTFADESEKEDDLITFSTTKVEPGVRRSTRQIRTKLF